MSHRITEEKVYQLLPSAYRARDAQEGYPLKALTGLLARQLRGVEADIDQLYDNLFIETCDEWAVPYIGELLGVKNFHPGDGKAFSLRRFVANTIAYRRRKGTVAAIEQLARDITAYPAKAVEFFQLLAWNQNVNHVRSHNLGTVNLRDRESLETLSTPFATSARTLETRLIQTHRGKYNVKNIGLFLWRLQAYEFDRVRPLPANGAPAGCFTFNPLGLDEALYNNPQSEDGIESLAQEIHTPSPLRRYPLFLELNERRSTLANGKTPDPVRFLPEAPPFTVFVDSNTQAIAPAEILICDLSEWKLPPSSKPVTLADGSTQNAPIRAGVDPELGRLALPATETANPVLVSYYRGAASDMGGGAYDRSDSLPGFVDDADTWVIGVAKRLQGSPQEPIVDTITEALAQWEAQTDSTRGLIVILDSDSYEEDLTINIEADEQLAIVGGFCPEEENLGNPDMPFGILSSWSANGNRPHIKGSVTINGLANPNDENPGSLYCNGLLMESDLSVADGNLGLLDLAHCSLPPAFATFQIGDNPFLNIALARCIHCAITASAPFEELIAEECIFEKANHFVLSTPETPMRLEKCTVFGRVRSMTLFASNCIFTERVVIERIQEGCVRYSYILPNSVVPRKYQCIPDIAFDDQGNLPSLVEQTKLATSTRPNFTSERFAKDDTFQNGFAQLAQFCPAKIIKGAENRSEVGAYNHLLRPQREENIKNAITDYLPVGLESGLFYVS